MKSGLRFVCTIAGVPEDTFAVGEFSLQEGLSELFTLNLTLVRAGNANPFKPQTEIDLASLLMQEAVLQVFNGETEQRKITGIISHADWIGTDGNKTLYTVTVRPALWRLTLNQDSRIYHQQNVPALLNSLLKKHRVKADSKLYDTHQDREYVTQKRESDYAFFSRLAAEEGCSFWFEDETAFFSDSHLGMTAGLPLQYQPQSETAYGVDTIYQVRLGVGMSPQRSLHKDYNPENPRYHLSHMQSSEGFRDFGSQTPYTVFESYGRFQKDAAAKPFLKYRQEALDNQKQTGSGNSNCIKLMPGKIFEIKNHPHKPLNVRWQVVGISHHGCCPQALGSDAGEGTTLSNTFSFISGLDDYRPPFHYKPLAEGDETAMVVGPEGEEIFVNKDGAIKVHFHWNRYDDPDDGASCWVRVAQGWNGNGYGFMAIPRIGQEVIISYLNGDIDRPIVTGCVYNGLNRPPLDLPAQKTRTTFKTKTHKGKGFNELRFEDAKGSEEIYFHGQKDFTAHIENDAYWHIKHNQKSRIDSNRYHDIRADDHHQVAGSRKITTEGDVSHRIAGSQHTQTGDATVIDSGQEIHLKSGGKVVLEAASEITLKVGGTFLKVTPGGILCSPINVGQGSGGSGRGLALQLPEGVAPLPMVEFPAHPYCPLLAQQDVSPVIKPAKKE
ncbi:type VI secretion system Vgr family protein [Xenorhabdus bovienii]|uniref:type VI secretion system Vgr family protein n=1 Tax=Xenorhabdus bovienii TaxID=40576 RepID=UPI0023B2DF9F|nr:type VI secretion system tip protein TssI/VgrG [Xenorhabdus bovienii]MDE9432368.1 type VI secretion system tip protein VgrG [Xenorhabdus bovienii]MDE9446826.1 type VI secretion system tip protein VgrG [Xenorhabdus bovienii]MDE9490123.1 type VI secretion system tip protein VgrG [Xenorhabdus bovienii]MDE9506168.1 type VI secretion system tip protein VgrG [Xenorhabdus bovienii]MDE9547676.1 type VI secretion system tip protein VgrG [Xenorhabdus bovienii]